MKVRAYYDNGRIDVFDTDSLTAAQPLGPAAALANFELRLDAVGDAGMWLEAHHYDVDHRAPGEGGEAPAAPRRRGWRFLLAEREELDHVELVTADGEEVAFRLGGELVDAARFARAAALHVPNWAAKSRCSCAAELLERVCRLPGFSEADPLSAAASFGFGPGALDAALAAAAPAGAEGGGPAEWDREEGRRC